MTFSTWYENHHMRRWKKAPQTQIKSNKVKSSRKPAPKKKASCKCEAEEIYHKTEKNFEKEGWKTEISGTKVREEIRDWSQNWDLLGTLLHKISTFQIIFCIVCTFTKDSLRKLKTPVDRKNLKYGENETNAIFTIDNTNVFKKERSQLFEDSFWNIRSQKYSLS